MTKIEMILDGNLFVGFRMEGHAEFNKGGPDILCSALSAISQMTINGVLDWIGVSEEDTIKERMPKLAILHFEIPWYLTSLTTNQMFKSFEMYVEQLTEQYKENVSLGRRQKDDYTDN